MKELELHLQQSRRWVEKQRVKNVRDTVTVCGSFASEKKEGYKARNTLTKKLTVSQGDPTSNDTHTHCT